MDQNKSEGPGPRQFQAAPVQRGSFVPTARSFGAPPRPVMTPQPAPAAPQQFTPPAPAAPAPQQPAQFTPLSFAPPEEPAKKPKLKGAIKFKDLSYIQKIAAGLVVVLLVLGVGFMHHQKTPNKQVLGVKTHGRKIPVSKATISDNSLETSCYTVAVPSEYQVTHTAGCASVMSAAKAADAAISLVSTPSSSTFTIKDAPAQIRSQLKLLGNVTEFKTAPTEVNGVKALKVVYQIGQTNEQALIFVPGLPAKYVSNDDAAGAFMIRGAYGTPTQQSSFDSLVQSLKWMR